MKIILLVGLVQVGFYSPANQNNLEHLSFKELDSIFIILFSEGDYKMAYNYAQFGRKKALAELGNKDSIYANFTSNFALINKKFGNYQIAEKLYDEAAKLMASILGEEHLDYLTTINNLANLNKHMGYYDKADSLYKNILDKQAKSSGKNQQIYITLLNNLASLYQETGQYNEAEPLLLESLAIRTDLGKQNPIYAIALNNLGFLYYKMQRYEEAETLFLENLNIRAKTMGKESLAYASSLNNLALLYFEMRRFKESEEFYLETLNTRIRIFGKKNMQYAISMNNLAALYNEQGKYEIAENQVKKSLVAIRHVVGENHDVYANSLNTLAHINFASKDFSNSEANYLKLATINLKTLGKNHPNYANSLNNLARLYFEIGQYKKAWNYAHSVIASISPYPLKPKIDSTQIKLLKFAPYNSNRHLIELDKALVCLYDILALKKDTSNKHKQALIVDLAIHLLHRNKIGFLGEKDKLRLLSESHNWMLRSLYILDLNHHFNKAFRNIEFHKSNLLMEANSTNRAYQLAIIPDSLAIKEKNLKNNQRALQAALIKAKLSTQKDSIRGLLNDLHFQINSLKFLIEDKYPKFAKIKYWDISTTVAELQSTLSNQEALIEYVLGDSIVYIFYIANNAKKALKIPIPTDTLRRRIQLFRKSLSDFSQSPKNMQFFKKFQSYIQNANWFYDKLLKPVLRYHNSNINQLIIIPDGELGHLPFESFLTSMPPSPATPIYAKLPYLINKYAISYHSSASLWKENNDMPKKNNNGQLLAMAAHYANMDSMNSYMRLPVNRRLRAKLNPIPAAKFEVEILANEFKGIFCFDTLATERIFKKNAKNFGIIHLAMHGMLNKQFPTLSSLFFTEDNDSIENNILQAYEISRLDLNADLVVLSACETGYGRFERGNGIASLARAFMFAGVPSLVVSLWQVDDLATSKIMRKFYENLTNGLNKTDALRQAKLNYIHQAGGINAHPAYWSPFIQIGNSKPIEIQRKYAYAPWYAGILVMFLVIVLIFWKRR